MKINYDDIQAGFAKGARSFSTDSVYKNQIDWADRGVKLFKRRVLGLCGKRKILSLDELARILMELNIVDSIKDGKTFVGGLYVRERVSYGTPRFYTRFLEFKRVYDNKGTEFCEIKKESEELS